MDADNRSVTAKTIESGRGGEWIREGWTLFKRHPGIWVAIILIWAVFNALIGFVPLGDLVSDLILPVIAGGLMAACKRSEQGGAIGIDALFEGFRSPALSSLLLLGAVAAAGGAITDLLFEHSLGGDPSGLLTSGAGSLGLALPSIGVGGLLASLVALLLMLLLTMALWFAPALVVLRQMRPLEAIQASFEGFQKNFWPLTVYSLLALVVLVVAAIPLGLGLLVALPVLFVSIYCSYRDIYGS